MLELDGLSRRFGDVVALDDVGKIVGIGLLGLAQLLLIAAVGLVTAQVVGSLRFPTEAIATIGLAVLWFVLGFFFTQGCSPSRARS